MFLADDSVGFLFVFNPGPRPVCAALRVDEGLGISNSSAQASFIAHEIYPREEVDGRSTPLGVWRHAQQVSVCVKPESALVIRVTKLSPSGPGSLADMLPLVLNLSYVSAQQTAYPSGQKSRTNVRVAVTGAQALAGADMRPTVLAAIHNSSTHHIHSVVVNGHVVSNSPNDPAACASYRGEQGLGCASARFRMGGDAYLRAHAEATSTSPPASYRGGAWFNSSFTITDTMVSRLEAQQKAYPIPWTSDDLVAPWLGSRLLLFPYITQPDRNLTKPRLWIHEAEQVMTPAFNSRGYEQDKCFLGWYFDASSLQPGTHRVSLWMPKLDTSTLQGIFWRGLSDVYTNQINEPLAAGNLTQCAMPSSTPRPPSGSKNVLYILVDGMPVRVIACR